MLIGGDFISLADPRYLRWFSKRRNKWKTNEKKKETSLSDIRILLALDGKERCSHEYASFDNN